MNRINQILQMLKRNAWIKKIAIGSIIIIACLSLFPNSAPVQSVKEIGEGVANQTHWSDTLLFILFITCVLIAFFGFGDSKWIRLAAFVIALFLGLNAHFWIKGVDHTIKEYTPLAEKIVGTDQEESGTSKEIAGTEKSEARRVVCAEHWPVNRQCPKGKKPVQMAGFPTTFIPTFGGVTLLEPSPGTTYLVSVTGTRQQGYLHGEEVKWDEVDPDGHLPNKQIYCPAKDKNLVINYPFFSSNEASGMFVLRLQKPDGSEDVVFAGSNTTLSSRQTADAANVVADINIFQHPGNYQNQGSWEVNVQECR